MTKNTPYFCCKCNKRHFHGNLYKNHKKYRNNVHIDEFDPMEKHRLNTLLTKIQITGNKDLYKNEIKKLIVKIKKRGGNTNERD